MAGTEGADVSDSWQWVARRPWGPEDTGAGKHMGPLQVTSQELGNSTQQTCVNSNSGEQCNQPLSSSFQPVAWAQQNNWDLVLWPWQKRLKTLHIKLWALLADTGYFSSFLAVGTCCCLQRPLPADWDAWLGFLSHGAWIVCLVGLWFPDPRFSHLILPFSPHRVWISLSTRPSWSSQHSPIPFSSWSPYPGS